ncbi:MAG: cistern family PEP-CTERM protein [Novosphingobium sp.]
MNKLAPIAAFAAMSLPATPAMADAITLNSSNIGQSYTLNFNGFSGSTVIDGLTSLATFTLTAVTGNSYTFNYSLSNTTSAPLDSRLSGFGFNTDPNISGASSTGAFSYTTLNSSYPNGIGAIDVCFKDAATGSCSGGGSGGLADGTTGTGTFTLNFSQPLTSLTLSDFYVRYQSIAGAGNITSASGAGTLTSTGGTSVPEPGMLGLFGAALVGVGLMRRRQTLRTVRA